MGRKVALNRKRVYGIIAIFLIVCISLSVFFSLNVNASVEEQKLAASPEASATPNPTSTPTNQAVDVPTSTLTPSPTETPHLMTEEEALAMATPLIEQYASENNRTVTSIRATFNSNTPDIKGSRGGPSTPDTLANSNIKLSCYPGWEIDASFNNDYYEVMLKSTEKLK